MRQWRLRPWYAVALLLMILLVALIVTVNKPDRQPSGLENATGSAMSPVISFVQTRTAAMKEFFARLFRTRDIDKEYEELKNRVAKLEIENQSINELRAENERLTRLLGMVEEYPEYQFLQAKVISREPGGWYSEFVINLGSKNGVKADMSVVNENGLVGRVTQVAANWSRVVTIVDSRNAVSVVVERSRDDGILRGSDDPNSAEPLCRLMHLPFDANLVPGDQIVTSSLGGIYPKGIVVGTVVEVSNQEGLESYATVKPAVDFSSIENVLLIVGGNEGAIVIPTDGTGASTIPTDGGTQSPGPNDTATEPATNSVKPTNAATDGVTTTP